MTTSHSTSRPPTPSEATSAPKRRAPAFSRGTLLCLVVLFMALSKLVLEHVFHVETEDLRVALLVILIGIDTFLLGQLVRHRSSLALPIQLALVIMAVAGWVFAWQVLETKDETKVAHWLANQGAGVTYANGQILQEERVEKPKRDWRPANWAINVLGESYFSQLDVIDMRAAEIVDSDVDYLAKIRGTRRLLLSGSQLTSRGVAKLPNIPGLEVMALDWRHVTPAAMARLRQFGDLKQLRLNDDSALRLLDETFKPPIELLADMEQLEILVFDAEFLTAEDLSVVGGLPNLRHLEILAGAAGNSRNIALGLPPIQGDNPDEDEVNALLNLAKSQSLESIHIDLQYLGVTAADVRALARIPNLRTLRLSGRIGMRFALTHKELEQIRAEFPTVNFSIRPVTPSPK